MTDSNLRFQGAAEISGKIVLLTGLHIGAGKDTIEIGGIDNPVIRHPHTKEPYIPGSSLKGKLRFLMEWAFDKVRGDGKPWGSDDSDEGGRQTFERDDQVLRIFGTAAKKDRWDGGPTRLIVRDAHLNAGWRAKAMDLNWSLTEDKTEVVIDRIQGKAYERIGPRQTERVPAGAEFDLAMSFRLYDVGSDGGRRDRECLNWLLQGLSLVEQDALGGSGSRGYGRIDFRELKVRLPDQDQARDTSYRRNIFDPEQAPGIV